MGQRGRLPLTGLAVIAAAWALAGCEKLDERLRKLEELFVDPEAEVAERGQELFAEECASCHAVDSARNGRGPHLVNIYEREAGTVATFPAYSMALRRANFTWDEERLIAYTQAPREAVPGTRMQYPGLDDREAARAIAVYLKWVSRGDM